MLMCGRRLLLKGRNCRSNPSSDPVAELDANGTLQALNTSGASGLVSRHTAATGTGVFYTFDERGKVAHSNKNSRRTHSLGPATVLLLLVPKGGLEPPRGCPQRFLRPPRLPFRHFGHCRQSSEWGRVIMTRWERFVNGQGADGEQKAESEADEPPAPARVCTGLEHRAAVRRADLRPPGPLRWNRAAADSRH